MKTGPGRRTSRRLRSSATPIPTPDPAEADNEGKEEDVSTLQVNHPKTSVNRRTLLDCVPIPRAPSETVVHGVERGEYEAEERPNPGSASSSGTKPTARTRSTRQASKTPSFLTSDTTSDSDANSGDDYGPEGDRSRRIHTAPKTKSNRSVISLNSSAGTSSNSLEQIPEELVETASMKPHDLAYNTRYRLLICKRCSCGVPFKSILAHLQSQGRYYTFKEGMWQQAKIIHPAGQRINKRLESNITSELIALGYHGFEGTPQQPPSPAGPIRGLHIFSNVKLCTKCSICFTKDQTFRNHHGREHGSYTVPRDAPIVDAQSLFMAGDSKPQALFALKSSRSSAPKPAILESKSTPEVSPAELMRRQKAGQLDGHGTAMEDPLTERVVLPYLRNSGIASFLEKFEAQDLVNAGILPRLTSKKAPPRLLRLRYIVLLSYIQGCQRVEASTEASRYPFGKADT